MEPQGSYFTIAGGSLSMSIKVVVYNHRVSQIALRKFTIMHCMQKLIVTVEVGDVLQVSFGEGAVNEPQDIGFPNIVDVEKNNLR